MKYYKCYRMALSLFILLFVSTNITAQSERILPVPAYIQQATFSCWAAAIRMVIDAGGRMSLTEMQIRQRAFPPNGIDQINELIGGTRTVDQLLWEIDQVFTDPFGQSLAILDVVTRIDQSFPIIVGWQEQNNPTNGHMVVIKGYRNVTYLWGVPTSGTIVYNDPFSGTTEALPIADFTNNVLYRWRETLVAKYPAVGPITVNISARVDIDRNNSTAQITQSPQSLTFRANASNFRMPITWNWNLMFPHSNGEYIAASWTQTTSNHQSIWNIPNFVLPSNYKWTYNFEGVILGRVSVTASDNVVWRSDMAPITYVPSGPLYPGVVVYADRIVSGTHAEVKAHELIIIRNVQFLPGSNITFRSGGRIDIGDGVNVQNGSNVNFIIDPSIW